MKRFDRLCAGCNKQFNGYDSVCMACKAWYFRYRRKLKFAEFLGGKCFYCGIDDIECLDFHHKDPTKKEFTISQFLNKISDDRILDEIKKCELVCANCHRKIHHMYKQKVIMHFIGNYNKDDIINSNKKYVARKYLQKIDWPTKEELYKLVWEMPSEKVAKTLGVTGGAIKYWCDIYEIKKPPLGYWTIQRGPEKTIISTQSRKNELMNFWIDKAALGLIDQNSADQQILRLNNMTPSQIYRQYKKKVISPPKKFYLNRYKK